MCLELDLETLEILFCFFSRPSRNNVLTGLFVDGVEQCSPHALSGASEKGE